MKVKVRKHASKRNPPPIESLTEAIRQLEDLRCDREDFADYSEEDNVFVRDIAAIDTALTAMRWLIDRQAEKGNDMEERIKHNINCYEEQDMIDEEELLKKYGYIKTADCMWLKMYKKSNVTVVLNREWD